MKSKPKLAAVFGHFSTYAEMSNWQDLERLVNPCGMFDQVHVLAIGDDHAYPAFVFGTVRVHRVRSPVPIRWLKRFNDLLVLVLGTAYLWWIVRRFNIDLIAHVDSAPVKFGVPAVFVARHTGLPCLITLHSDYARVQPTLSRPLSLASRILWPYVFRRATMVRSVSRPIAEFAYDHGVSQDRVMVIPNKEDLAPFRNAVPEDVLEETAEELELGHIIGNSVIFLSVGRLIPVKNLQRCIEAFARSHEKHPDIAYLVVGTGRLQADLERQVESLGVGDRVRFLGYFPHELLAQVYQLSDVFLFPTLWEGHPRVVLEAMAARLPIICSNYGAITDLVTDADAIFVDPTDVSQISVAISRLATDEAHRQGLSAHPEFDPDDFSIETVGRREAELYAAVLSEAGFAKSRMSLA